MKKCCVLIPYYNDGDSLLRSIESIDSDRVKPDVVVIDDGSSLCLARDFIKSYDGELEIVLLDLPVNKGIEHALNKGLEYALDRYEYIARLDCGDICKNSRISKQIQYLNENTACQLVGSWVDFMNLSGSYLYTLKQPDGNHSIKRNMFINCAFTHPAVMFRSQIIRSVGPYPLNRPAAEDYALFFKIVKKFDTANIQEALVDCEVNPNGISSQKRRVQIKSRIRIILDNFEVNPYALYGLFRGIALLYTPRSFTVFLRRLLR